VVRGEEKIAEASIAEASKASRARECGQKRVSAAR
jgi:hypothetical protein